MEISKVKNLNSIQTQLAGHVIEVTIYTDPLCCWSWAFQPQLEQLQNNLSDTATWHYRMGGLIPTWKNYYDEANSVSRPAQMGPVWMHAGQIANRPIAHQVWLKDPPSSSYPACIAVKCAQFQSESSGAALLNLLREACMTEGKNIARQPVIFEAATKLSSIDPEFDFIAFKDHYSSDAGQNGFRADLDLVRNYNINRFPTLIIKSIRKQKSIIVSGYRRYEELLQTINEFTSI